MKNEFADTFEVDSVVKALVLCVLTLGCYLIYKLYRFSTQINQHTQLKISNSFIVITISLFIISLASLLYALPNIHDANVFRSLVGIHVISSIFDVTWIIMVRNRINKISGAKKGDKLWLNPFITSIFHVIYMQYKINQTLTKTSL